MQHCSTIPVLALGLAGPALATTLGVPHEVAQLSNSRFLSDFFQISFRFLSEAPSAQLAAEPITVSVATLPLPAQPLPLPSTGTNSASA
jgi:hypothetical protein